MKNLQRYFKDIRKYRGNILSQKELNNLIVKHKNGDIKAKEKIIKHNQGLVIFIAKWFEDLDFNIKDLGINRSDLIQYGNKGLARAVDKFDPSKNIQFSTYAFKWIKGEMFQALEDSGAVKLPDHKARLFIKIKKCAIKLEKETKRKPLINEIAEEVKLKPELVKWVLFSKGRTESLDDTRKFNDDEIENSFDNMIDKFIRTDVEAEFHNDDLDDFYADWTVTSLLDELSEEERNFMIGYYGLFGNQKFKK